MKRRLPSPLLETLIRPAPPAEVTVRAEHELPARCGGLEQADIDAIWRAVEQLYASGLHPAIALCIRRRGAIVLDRAIGHARGNGPDDGPHAPRVQATPDTLFNIFSAAKSVTAMLVHILDDRGLLHVSDRVVEYLPEFGQCGKERTTLGHIMSHRAGIPAIPVEHLDLDLLSRPDEIVQRLCAAKPAFVPGRRLAYHALTGGFILGAVIERVTGKPLREVLRREVLEPLGLTHMNYGVEPGDIPAVAENVFTGPPLLPPIRQLARRAIGADFREAIAISNDPRFLTAVVPAGNIIGTAEEVCRFYQLLLDEGRWQDEQVFEPRTLRRATQEASWLEVDLTLALPVRYGMGFVLGGDIISLYGPRTAHAFGHLGFTNVLAWADPERELAACLMTNGKPLFTPRLWRLARLMGTIARTTRR